MKQKYYIILTAIFTLQVYGMNKPEVGTPRVRTPEAYTPRAGTPRDNSQDSSQAISQPMPQRGAPVHRYSNRSLFVFPEEQQTLENGLENSSNMSDADNGTSNSREYDSEEGYDTEIDADYWLERYYDGLDDITTCYTKEIVMKHTYFITALTAALVCQAYGMKEEGQAGAADANQASGITVTFAPAISGGQLADVNTPSLWRYEIDNSTGRASARPARSEDIPAAMGELRKLVRDKLEFSPNSPENPHQIIPHESDPDLHIAIFMRSQPYVEWLIRYESLNLRNAKGQTALEYARERARLSLNSDDHIAAMCRAAQEQLPEAERGTIELHDLATQVYAMAKRTSDHIVDLLENRQKEYVLECAKKVVGSMLTPTELRRLWIIKEENMDSRACIEECAQAMQILLGQTPARPELTSAAQPALLVVQQPAAQVEPEEEKEEDVDADELLTEMYKARQKQS